MRQFLSDLIHALRQWRARPGLWLAIVVTLALGLGANTAVFSVIHSLLLRPLPFPDADRLVMVYNTYPKNDLIFAGTSIPDYLDRKQGAPSFEDLAMLNEDYLSLTLGNVPERIVAGRVTPSLFTVLQQPAAFGRVLLEEDAKEGAAPVVVLSHSMWQRLYGADRTVIGRDLVLSGRNYQIVGVMPEGFAFPDTDRQLYIPLVFTQEQMGDGERGNEYSISIGRLKPGATLASANAEMDVLVERVGARLPDYKEFYDSAGFTGRAEYLQKFFVGELAGMLGLLQAATLFVLLIAAANVANLLLAQGLARRREFSVRSAMGAGRGRLFGQVIAEALLAALAGAALGLLVAKACLLLLGGQLTQRMGGSLFVPGIDNSVLLYTLALSALVAVLIALLPAWVVSRHSLVEGLKDGGHGTTSSRVTQVSRNALVVVQLALSVALLVGAGLLLRSFARLSDVQPGFNPENLYSAAVVLNGERYDEPAPRLRFFDNVLRDISGLPGVEGVGVISGLPFTPMANSSGSFGIRGEVYDATHALPHAYQRVIDPGYADAAKVPLLRGRHFTSADSADAPKVAIIDKLLADKHFPGQDPIGKQVSFGDGSDPDTVWFTIVGVVGTVKSTDLGADVRKETMYVPLAQRPARFVAIIVRSKLPLETLTAGLRSAFKKIDPGLPMFDIKTMQQRITESLGPRRAPMQLLLVFATIALVLAAVGIYAVLAFLVGQRSGEIGVRMAIGAGRQDILRMVLKQSANLIVVGIGIGTVAALFIGRGLATQLFGVSQYDPLTYAGVVALLAVVALIASLVPARRASVIDPLRALRQE
jgi:predicted permease